MTPVVLAHQRTHPEHIAGAEALTGFITPTLLHLAGEHTEDAITGGTGLKQNLLRLQLAGGQARGKSLHGVEHTGIHAR